MPLNCIGSVSRQRNSVESVVLVSVSDIRVERCVDKAVESY